MFKIRRMEWAGHAESGGTMINLGDITGKKEGKRRIRTQS
jgi:hypothetical protein